MRIVTVGRTRYEWISDGCATRQKNCPNLEHQPLTVFILKHGTNDRQFGMTSCIPGDQITHTEEIPDVQP